jgi:hypothetical protein
MAKIKYAICSAIFYVGLRSHARLFWYAGPKRVNDGIEWTRDVEKSTFFEDEESCGDTYQSIIDYFRTLHICDEGSLNIMTILWDEYDDLDF